MKVLTHTEKYKVILFGDNVVFTVYPDGVEIELEDMKKLVEIELAATKGQPFYAISDFRNMFGNMSNETKEFIAKNEKLNELKQIEILIVNSLPLKLLTRGYLKIFKPKTETVITGSNEELFELLEKREIDFSTIQEIKDHLQSESN